MVYVDEPQIALRNKDWPYKYACHLVADSEDELHRFAAALGLKRAWFQPKETLPHYDLTVGMRRKARAAGAAAITRRQLGERIREARKRIRGQDNG